MRLREQHPDEVEVNIAPLIDVVFLLLIFFMLTTTFEKEARLTIDLPAAESPPQQPLEQPTEITIDAGGTIYPAQWRAALQQLSTLPGEHPLLLRADRQAPHGAVVEVMDRARQLHLLNLSIVTESAP
ncbi:MAG: biopolymer transporter ExbD [Gammaproteobacteria bacterium]|jgi:biopolymer transport protein ExbD|nr:biopolymer transporter ExbD [Gammaproteobacteria bacterium]